MPTLEEQLVAILGTEADGLHVSLIQDSGVNGFTMAVRRGREEPTRFFTGTTVAKTIGNAYQALPHFPR